MTPSWSRSVLTISLAVCLGGACTDEPDEDEAPTSETIIYQDGGPYPPISESRFLAAYGRARAALLARCCDYIGRSTTALDSGPPAPSVRSGAVYDPAAGAACIAQYYALSCPHGKEPPETLLACQSAYRNGQLQRGESCTTDWECEQDADATVICAATLTERGLVRSCEQPEVRWPRAGEPCLDAALSGTRCPLPMTCRADETCGLPRLGEACMVSPVFGDSCDKGAVCDRAQTRLCVQPKRVGAPCAAGDECELYACIDGVCAEPLWGLDTCTVRPELPQRDGG